MDTLEGKAAVITGGASGMGLAFARRLGQAGMRVAIADIERDALDTAVRELIDEGIEAIGVPTDVSSSTHMEALRDETLEAFEQINVVCLNAGVAGENGRSWLLTEADWSWTLGVNLWGVIHGIRMFVPHLIEHGDGHVVTTASIAGHTSFPYGAPYNATKHSVVTITESLHHELAFEKSTVGTTCLCPGFVATQIVASDRNRPSGLGPIADDDKGRTWQERAGAMVDAGKDPAEVADLVHNAILSNQFYLFTDEEWDGPIASRHGEIAERRPPTLGLSR